MAMSAGPRLQLQGDRQSGQDVRTQNVTAVAAIANIVKSSLGPVGLDKVRADSGRRSGRDCLATYDKLVAYPARVSSRCRCSWTTSAT